MSIASEFEKKYHPLVDAYSMGDSPQLADELLALILDGRKTASCCSVFEQERDGFPMPNKGDYYLILDGRQQPAAIIQTTEVKICRFDEVDEAFARDEGEGDLSYTYWRDAHETYFTRNGGFSPDMLLICERFELIEALK